MQADGLQTGRLVSEVLSGGVVGLLLPLLARPAVYSSAALVLVQLVRVEALRQVVLREAGWAPLLNAVKSSVLAPPKGG